MAATDFSSTIEAVSFDAAGTLIHLAEPVGVSYSRVAARFGIDAGSDELNSAFRATWKRTPLPFSLESSIHDRNEKSWWARLVREVFAAAGVERIEEEQFSAFFEALYDHFESPGTWVADPAAAEVVARVAARYRCVVLSNFDARLRRILEELGLLPHFEGLILSCEIGASKPDRKIFEAAAAVLDLPPAAILHVGDDPVCDWQGARDSGFRLFRIGEEYGSLRELLSELSLA